MTKSNLHPIIEAALRGVMPREGYPLTDWEVREAEARADLPPLAVEIDRLRFLRDAVVAAYDKAIKDPQTRIPTYLHLAIEHARK